MLVIFFIGSFDNFQDNGDHFKVVGLQLTEYPTKTDDPVFGARQQRHHFQGFGPAGFFDLRLDIKD